jgi:hypothetical protein
VLIRKERVIAVLTAAFVLTVPSTAFAGDEIGQVTCGQQPQAGCDVHAGTPSSLGTTGSAPSSDSGSGTTCKDAAGQTAPCTDPQLGSVGSDGCYYAPVSAPAGASQPAGAGGWFQRTCTGATGSGAEALSGPVWVPAGAAVPVASPEQVARMASARLVLPSPAVSTNPAADAQNLVGVPVWGWVSRTSWGPRSATASVPGVSVTATATPTSVSWSWGDGSTVECGGPGTVWVSGTDPLASSPTCGHTYTVSSAVQPGGRYAVTVTVDWVVSWAGAGRSGTLPDLSTSASVRLDVAESQALNGAT